MAEYLPSIHEEEEKRESGRGGKEGERKDRSLDTSAQV